MEADWDLHAVVRGCAATPTTVTTSSGAAVAAGVSSSSSNSSCSASSVSCSSSCGGFGYPIMFPPVFEPNKCLTSSSIAELHDLCKPNNFVFPKSHLLHNSFKPLSSSSSSSPSSSSSSSSSCSPSSLSCSSSSAPKSTQTTHIHQRQQQHLPTNKHSHHPASLTTPRSKRRKNQIKRVCQVPAEAVCSDVWAWRKYGQKPIKGSPYPRGYYRCSSSKVCLARKQVERNRSDPTMFIVTYTAEHNHPAPTHRNSLAGSTRQKPLTPPAADGSPAKPFSPAEEDLASQGTARSESKDDDEENGFGLSDMELTDDFFEGLDELTGSPATETVAGECFGDPISASIEFSAWVANDASSAAGGT